MESDINLEYELSYQDYNDRIRHSVDIVFRIDNELEKSYIRSIESFLTELLQSTISDDAEVCFDRQNKQYIFINEILIED